MGQVYNRENGKNTMSARNREDVLRALDELMQDLRHNSEEWENPTLERYLEAMRAWLEDSGRKADEPPSWELIVRMLNAGKIYE